jgi:molecular chaperone GrpE
MEPETPDVPVGEPEGSSAEAEVAIEEEKVLAVEDLLTELEAVIAQRDEYLALAQAKQAEFENFRKRMMKQQADELARASSKLVEAMLPVLDAFDYGVAHGDDSLAPMRAQLLGVLEREGLARLDPTGEAFDPNEHEAVAHEPGDGGEPLVAEALRAGYRWQGHLLRPVMVRVRD